VNALKEKIENGLTVGALIDELKNFDRATPVVFAYDYGDHWRTEVASTIETADSEEIRWSDYHSMPVTVGDDEIDGTVSVVILRG
jgi:hypothetical protein